MLAGEIRSADVKGAAEARPLLAEQLKGFDNKHRENLDETGLYYKALPLRSHLNADDRAEGFKRLKARVTLVIITSADGDFEVILMNIFPAFIDLYI